MRENSWFNVENAHEYDSPALLLFPKRIKENIHKLVSSIEPGLLRPHVKTCKIPEVCSLMMEAGISKFKAATIAEAEMLAMIKAPDVLLAYQPSLPKIKRLIRLIQTYPETKFSCLVDSAEVAESISDLFEKEKLNAFVFIDLNVGMNRTGIIPENAVTLYQRIVSLPAIQFLGLHAYDGHIRDSLFKTRETLCRQAFEPVYLLKAALEKIAGHKIILVAGGTPTSFIHAGGGIAECSPGTFVFWDKGYAEQLPEQPFQFAAVVLSRVISIPSPDKICIDLGYKSIASENPLPRVYFLNSPEATPFAHSEEHLVLKVQDSGKFKVGDLFY